MGVSEEERSDLPKDCENSEKNDTNEKKKKWRLKGNAKAIEIPDDNVPYDRGWAWMIVFGK